MHSTTSVLNFRKRSGHPTVSPTANLAMKQSLPGGSLSNSPLWCENKQLTDGDHACKSSQPCLRSRHTPSALLEGSEGSNRRMNSTNTSTCPPKARLSPCFQHKHSSPKISRVVATPICTCALLQQHTNVQRQPNKTSTCCCPQKQLQYHACHKLVTWLACAGRFESVTWRPDR